ETYHTMFRRGVSGASAAAAQRGNGGDVGDGAPTRIFHERDDRAREPHWSAEIDRDNPIPRVVVEFADGKEKVGDTRDVREDRDRSGMSGLRHDAVDVVLHGDVRGDRADTVTSRVDR